MLRHSDEFVHQIGALLSHRSPCLPCHMAAGGRSTLLTHQTTIRGYTDRLITPSPPKKTSCHRCFGLLSPMAAVLVGLMAAAAPTASRSNVHTLQREVDDPRRSLL